MNDKIEKSFYAIHPHWNGVLRLLYQEQKAILFPFGSSGDFVQCAENSISVVWDSGAEDKFVFCGDIYVKENKISEDKSGFLHINILDCILDLCRSSLSDLAADVFLTAKNKNNNIDDEIIEVTNSIVSAVNAHTALLFIEHLARQEKSFRILVRLGEAYLDCRDFQKSIETWNEAQKFAPRNSWPSYYKGRAYLAKGDFDEAMDCFKKGLNNDLYSPGNLETLNIIKSYFDTLALKKSNTISPRKYVRSDLKTGRPCYQCIQVMLVKDEEDIIYTCLESAYINGVRLYAISNNNSSDGTLDEINRFRAAYEEAIVLVVDDPITGYYQDVKTLGLATMSKLIFQRMGYEANWIVPVDADEILQFGSSSIDLYGIFEKALEKNCKLILFYWIFAASSEIMYEFNKSDSLRSVFTNSNGYGEFPVRKAAFLIDPNSMPEVGNHFVLNQVSTIEEVLFALDYNAVMIHYSTRSIMQMKRKIINGFAALSAGKDLGGFGAHWRKEHEEYLKHGDAFFIDKLGKFIDYHKN